MGAGSLRQQAQGLPPRGNRCGEFDAGTGCLPLGVGGFGLDAQPGGQVGLAESERFVEETARFTRQLRASIGSGELRSRSVGARTGGLALTVQAGSNEHHLRLKLDRFGARGGHARGVSGSSAEGDAYTDREGLLVGIPVSAAIAGACNRQFRAGA